MSTLYSESCYWQSDLLAFSIIFDRAKRENTGPGDPEAKQDTVWILSSWWIRQAAD